MRKSLGILVALCATMLVSTPVLAAVHIDPGREANLHATSPATPHAILADATMTSSAAALPSAPHSALGDRPADGTFSSIGYMIQATHASNHGRGAGVVLDLGRALN